MDRVSLLEAGDYRAQWARDFYSQTAVWWGPNTDSERYERCALTLERLVGPGSKAVLDLGSGPGGIAAAIADRGHDVVAVEFSERARYARELAALPRSGSLTVVEADFYSVELGRRFDVVTCWDGIGFGSDADQRRLLRRIAGDWLASGGCAVLEVFNPVAIARDAGTEETLPALPGVPGSVEMVRRAHFDPVHCRWIDEWQPTVDASRSLAQTLRCYSPADFLLLLEGTGLRLVRLEVEGEEIDPYASAVASAGPLMEAYEYLVKLVPAGEADI